MYFPTATRPSLEGERFQVVVIGGGINGAAIARECARAGKRTLLLEQHDFGSGASSRDTRFIQETLRHNERRDSTQMRESAQQRRSLLAARPHLVHPKELLIACGSSGTQGLLRQRTSFWLTRQPGGNGPAAVNTAGDRSKVELLLGNSARWSLFNYDEAQCEFPERLVVEWLAEAAQAGAIVRNYTQALAVDVRQGRARGVLLRDRLSGSEAQIEATWIVNATGAGAERLCQRSRISSRFPAKTMRRSHIVLPNFAGAPEAALQIEDRDGKILSFVPWNRQILVGGCAVPDGGDPAKVEPLREDIEYLLWALQTLMPSLQVSTENIRYAFAGLFLEVAGSSGKSGGSYLLYDHAPDATANMTTVIGGTLSSARQLAREFAERLGTSKSSSVTQSVTQENAGEFESLFDDWLAKIAEAARVSEDAASSIAEWHGPRSQAIAELAQRDGKMRATLCPHTDHIVAETVDAFSNEFAVTLGDVLLRRVPVALGPCWSAACSREAVTRIRAVMGWSEQQAASELESFEMERAAFLRKPAKAGMALPAAAD
jgi:glycerol-3-phosphate dehydrogenase